MQADHDLSDVVFAGPEQVGLQKAERPARADPSCRRVRGLADQRALLICQQRAGGQVHDLGVGKQVARIASRAFIRCRYANRLVAFFVVVGGTDQLPIERFIEAAHRPGHVPKDILFGVDVGNEHARWGIFGLATGR